MSAFGAKRTWAAKPLSKDEARRIAANIAKAVTIVVPRSFRTVSSRTLL
jgi:hypothetical protein